MNATASTAPPNAAIPGDDLTRESAVARPDDDQTLAHWGVVGDTYTILISGEETAGRYTLIDMHVPTGGGPPPHRHDFEEMFSVLEGAVEVTFRGETKTASAGETFNIPANAPHVFKNTSQQPARLLCMCSPPGQEKFFAEVGIRVSTRTGAPPKLDEAAQKAFIAKAIALAPKYRTELLLP
jgi:quercetin dioxygenase-like cupin family protein